MSKNTQPNKTDLILTRITTIVALAAAVFLLIWGIVFFTHQLDHEDTNDAQIDEYINPVTAKVSGYIKDIRYEENQEVKKGDTLIIIDNSEYMAQQEEADAALLHARAQVLVLQSSVETAGNAAAVSQTQIAAARARLWKQEQELNRYKNLFAEESATKQQLESVQTAYDVARSEYETAQKSYTTSLSKVNDSRMQQGVVSAEIRQREAALKRNQLTVGYTVITAPYNGKMGRRTIQPGQLVQPGQTLAFIVDREAGKWVVANFKETQIRYMHQGQDVRVKVDAYPGKIYQGKIESFSAATGSRFSLLPPDNASGNFVKIAQRIPVRIKISGSPEELTVLNAGMNALVSVEKN